MKTAAALPQTVCFKVVVEAADHGVWTVAFCAVRADGVFFAKQVVDLHW